MYILALLLLILRHLPVIPTGDLALGFKEFCCHPGWLSNVPVFQESKFNVY